MSISVFVFLTFVSFTPWFFIPLLESSDRCSVVWSYKLIFIHVSFHKYAYVVGYLCIYTNTWIDRYIDYRITLKHACQLWVKQMSIHVDLHVKFKQWVHTTFRPSVLTSTACHMSSPCRYLGNNSLSGSIPSSVLTLGRLINLWDIMPLYWPQRALISNTT